MRLDGSLLRDVIAPTPRESERLATLAPWQATATCLGVAVLLLPMLLLPWWIADAFAVDDPIARSVLAGATGAALAVLCFGGIARLLGAPPRAIFLRRPTVRTLGWTAIGAGLGLALALLAIAASDGFVTAGAISPRGVAGKALAGAAIGLWTGTVEELFLRGAVLSIVGHQWSWPGAVLVTAAVFGAMHNAGAETTVGTAMYVALTGTAGLLFAMVVLATGNVWNAVAIHATWNTLFSQHVLVFGGTPDVSPLIRYELQPTRWFLGGHHVAPTESPLALALFLLAVIAYASVRLRRLRTADSDPCPSQP